MLRYIALFALVAAASATFYKPKCPMVPGKFPFELEKFHGDWFVAAGNDDVLTKKGKCGKINFPAFTKDQIKEDFILNSRYTGVNTKDNTPIAYESYAQPIISDKIANMYGVSRLEGSSTYSAVYKQTIVATDYTSYALYLACKPNFSAESKAFNSAVYAEVWTRPGVTLSKDTMDTLINVLSSYGIDAATIKPIERNC